jgi:hypothetical protein
MRKIAKTLSYSADFVAVGDCSEYPSLEPGKQFLNVN